MTVVGVAAGVTLLLWWTLLFSFFATGKEILDRLSEIVGLVFPPLMATVVVAIHRMYGTYTSMVWIVTVAACVSAVVMFATDAAVVFGGVPFTWVAMPATVGALGVVLLPGGVGWLALAYGEIPKALGWLGIGVAILAVGVILLWARDVDLLAGRRAPKSFEILACLPVIVAIPAWYIWLGVSL